MLKPRIPLFAIVRRELAGNARTTVPFAAHVLFNLEPLCAAPSTVVRATSLYVCFKRDGSITQLSDTAQTAERGEAELAQLSEEPARAV
jgi:hypothetical protein